MLFVQNTLETIKGSIAMKGIHIAQADEKNVTEDVFKRLENIRRKNDNLDYGVELASYRETKYGR